MTHELHDRAREIAALATLLFEDFSTTLAQFSDAHPEAPGEVVDHTLALMCAATLKTHPNAATRDGRRALLQRHMHHIDDLLERLFGDIPTPSDRKDG